MKDLPLDGVRVIDLSWVIAGPTATRFLAMMGAEVIKVGSARRPDPSTRGAPFQAYNQSKLYCAVNVSIPEAWRIQTLMNSLLTQLTTDGDEGRQAFLEKRPPVFTGGVRRKGEAYPEMDDAQRERLNEVRKELLG